MFSVAFFKSCSDHDWSPMFYILPVFSLVVAFAMSYVESFLHCLHSLMYSYSIAFILFSFKI